MRGGIRRGMALPLWLDRSDWLFTAKGTAHAAPISSSIVQ